MVCNELRQANTTYDVVKMTTELGRTNVEFSMTSGLVGGTGDYGLGLGIACNAFSPTDTVCDKAMSTAKLVISDTKSAVTVG